MSGCSRALLALSHVMTMSSVALTIAALSQQNFIQGIMSATGLSLTFSMGLFSSCLNYSSAASCNGSDPFYWTAAYRHPFAFYDQWHALQVFIIAEIVLRGFGWMFMATRSHWEQQYPASLSKINKIMNGFHISTVISGAIATACFGSMPSRLAVDMGISSWYGMTSILQFIAFGVGTLGVFAYVASRRYAESSTVTDTAPLLLPGNQVAIVVNGQTMLATIAPTHQQPFSAHVPHAHVIQPQQHVHAPQYTPNPMAYVHAAHHAQHGGYVHPQAPLAYPHVQPSYYQIN